MTKVTLVCHDLANNAAGRAWSLSMVFDELGWPWRVLAGASGPPWAPLADSAFLDRCSVTGRRVRVSDVREAAATTDLFVSVKAIPGSLGTVLRAGTSVPVLADIDDDDLAEWRDSLSRRQRLGLIRPTHWWHRSAPRDLDHLEAVVRTLPRMVSNPQLQDRYGGELVPHARRPELLSALTTTDRRPPVIGFIGSVKPHKGLQVLREAVATMPGGAWPLVVTAEPPPGALPHERWIGATPLAALADTLAQVDVAAVLSEATPFALAQAPVKVIDALLARRTVIASDLPVLRWMTGGAAMHVDGASVAAVRAGLQELLEPAVRKELAVAAHRHGMATFTPSAVAPRLHAAATRALP